MILSDKLYSIRKREREGEKVYIHVTLASSHAAGIKVRLTNFHQVCTGRLNIEQKREKIHLHYFSSNRMEFFS